MKLLIDTPYKINGVELNAIQLQQAAEHFRRASWQQYIYENNEVSTDGALVIADEALRMSEDSSYTQDDCIEMAKEKLGYIKYMENDFYSICMDGTEKEIVFHGYLYNSYDGSSTPIRNVRIEVRLPLSKYLSMIREEKEDLVSEAPSSIEDISGHDAKRIINGYYTDRDDQGEFQWTGKAKDVSTITMDTPCGDYVDYAQAVQGGVG